MQAVGVHVFAGGFTMGAKRVCPVIAQLESLNFGTATASRLTEVIQGKWPKLKVDVVYGNPRCTAFSCTTAGYGDHVHGPWAKQCIDIHDLCQYGLKIKAPIIMWESVQQAYTVGRPLLDHLRDELFFPKGYKIAHVRLSAKQFNNSQLRRRYFFVAYKTKRFNATLPRVKHDRTIGDDLQVPATHTRVVERNVECYDKNCYFDLNEDEWAVVPYLPQGRGLTQFAKENEELLEKLSSVLYDTWLCRSSGMPFSMHAITRPKWDGNCPTLRASSYKIIHPQCDRPLTIGELAKIMGWGRTIPVGRNPIAQLAKGVIPAIGQWIMKQARKSLENDWGSSDWEQVRYRGRLVLQKPANPREKEIRL